MVLKAEPVVAAIEAVAAAGPVHRVLLAARGTPLRQARVTELARVPALLLVCGRYEGVDERVAPWIDEEIAIGDYVLSGGELPALVLIDAVARLLPGALGNAASAAEDSFSTGLLEHAQYTRPSTFRGAGVPDVLAGGDHAAVRRWRREQALATTLARRPDLLRTAALDPEDRACLRRLGWLDDDEA